MEMGMKLRRRGGGDRCGREGGGKGWEGRGRG